MEKGEKEFDLCGRCDNNSNSNLPGDLEDGHSDEDVQLFEEQWSAAQDPSGIILVDQEIPCKAEDVRDKCNDPPCHSEQITHLEQEIRLSSPPGESTGALDDACFSHRQKSQQQQQQQPQQQQQQQGSMTAVPLVPVIPIDRTTAFGIGEGNQSTMRYDKFSRHGKRVIYGITLAIILAAAILGGVCGSGMCTAKTDPEVKKISTVPPTPSTTQSPTAQSSETFRSFTATQELYSAVDMYLKLTESWSPNSSEFNSSEVCYTYGCPIGIWDVSKIQDFSATFDPQRDVPLTSPNRIAELSSFNENLSGWDVSSATNFSRMFAYASAFEGYSIENWNVSSVVDMSFLFFQAKAFNANLSKWDTGHVVSMAGTFSNAQSFVGSNTLSSWNTSSLVELGAAFAEASSFNGDLSGWDVSHVKSLFGTFFRASSFSGKSISTWTTSSILNLTMCFDQAGAFDADLGGWDVSKAGDLISTFEDAKSFTGQGLENWKTENVSSMLATFKGTTSFTNADLSRWDTSKVTNMEWCFAFCPFNDGSITSWDTSQVTSMSQMFVENGSFNQSLIWNTNRVQTMDHMFEMARDFNQLLQFNTSSLKSMNNMFVGAKNFNQPLNFDTSQVTSMARVLADASTFNQTLNWNTRNVQNMEQILYRTYAFNGSGLEYWDVSNVENLVYAFAHLPWFSPDLSMWQTGNVQNLSATFWNCSSFQSDLSNWQTGNVLDLEATFYKCPMFQSNLSQWDVSQVTSTSGTFEGATRFQSDLSSWNVSSVHRADGMFYDTQFNSDISNWDVSRMETLEWMFGMDGNFSQNLCAWADRVMPTAIVSNMFVGTACEFNQDPEQEIAGNGTVHWVGPWCSSCVAITPTNDTQNNTL
jgi:surface protein